MKTIPESQMAQSFIDGMKFCYEISKRYKAHDKETMQNFINEIEEHIEQAELIMDRNKIKPPVTK